jgi:hypothetical protein
MIIYKNTSIAQDFHHGVHFEVEDEKNQQNHISRWLAWCMGENSGPAMGQAPNCGWIKPVNVTPTLLS